MELEEVELLKQSEKNTAILVREKSSERIFVQKTLKGQLRVYSELLNCPHPYLSVLYEVNISDNTTTILEEHIEGQSLGAVELSDKQVCNVIKELCTVLEFLHEKGIIHRDIKPSNIIFAKDGHIRLIDFDAARMVKDNLEQDTRLLGTRGYAPPEQYGFAQTDARADIYSLGVTLEQLLGEKAQKPRYKRIIRKCTNLNPDKRYQSARQVKRTLSYTKRNVLYSVIAILLAAALCYNIPYRYLQQEEAKIMSEALTVLPAPENPHWNGDTGIALWGNVPDSGTNGEVRYYWRLYREDTATSPDLSESVWEREGGMRGNGGRDNTFPTYEMNLAAELRGNGFYYFAVSAVGDGVNFADSPYVISDAFEYTGESAPFLPTPTGLEWKIFENQQGRQHLASWSNLDDYADADSFNVRVHNRSGVVVLNNIWTKERINSLGRGGVWLNMELLTEEDGPYRFTIQALTSRPNEYKSNPIPEAIAEESYSPWLEANE